MNEMQVSYSADTVGGIQALLSREQKQSSFPILWGSMFLMIHFQLIRHCVSSPWQFSRQQVVPDVIQPLALRTSSPSLPRHLYHHHYIAHTFFFSSQYMTIPLQTTFMHLLDRAFFSHLRYPSNSFIHYSVQLGNSAHPFPPFIVISSLPMYIGFCPGSPPSYISCTIIT